MFEVWEHECVSGFGDRRLPDARRGQPRSVQWLIVGAACFVVLGVAFWSDIVSGDEGFWGQLPGAAKLMLLAVSLAGCLLVVGVGLRWLVPHWRGHAKPMVEFREDHLVLRNALVPRTFVIGRDEILATWVRQVRIPRGVFRPKIVTLVMTKTSDGRYRGIADHFDGTPERLADDIAAWAAVPRLEDEDVFRGPRH